MSDPITDQQDGDRQVHKSNDGRLLRYTKRQMQTGYDNGAILKVPPILSVPSFAHHGSNMSGNTSPYRNRAEEDNAHDLARRSRSPAADVDASPNQVRISHKNA